MGGFSRPQDRRKCCRFIPALTVRNGFQSLSGRATTVDPGGHRMASVCYFLSNTGGKVEIWSQPLDQTTKRPIENPKVAYFPGQARFDLHMGHTFGPAVAENRLVVAQVETTGNVWIAEPQTGR